MDLRIIIINVITPLLHCQRIPIPPLIASHRAIQSYLLKLLYAYSRSAEKNIYNLPLNKQTTS